jgi:hypothetical protein
MAGELRLGSKEWLNGMAYEDKKWVIINLECVFFDADLREIHALPERFRPTVIYSSKGKAEDELLRLQQTHSEEEFVLFEAVAHAVPGQIERGVLFIEDI